MISDLGNIKNKSKYAAYRVVVYRVNPGAFKTKTFSFTLDGVQRTADFDEILNADPLSKDYLNFVDWVTADPSVNMTRLLREYYDQVMSAISKGMSSDSTLPQSLYSVDGSDSLVRAIDVTPLVTRVSSNINISDVNSCSLSTINPCQASFNLSQLSKTYAFNSWMNNVSRVNGSAPSLVDLLDLKKFKFREYDLVRVYAYNGDVPLVDALDAAVSRLEKAIGEDDKKLKHVYANVMPVAFTGIVVSVKDSVSPGRVSQAMVDCHGMMRVFGNTSTISDQALCSQIAMQNSGVADELSLNKKFIKVWSNYFSDKNAAQAFSYLIDDMFKSERLDVKFPDGKPGLVVGGAPSIFKLINSMYVNGLDGSDSVKQGEELSTMGSRFKTYEDIQRFWPTDSSSTTSSSDGSVSTPSIYNQKSKSLGNTISSSSGSSSSLVPSFVQLFNLVLCYTVMKTRAGELMYYMDDSMETSYEVSDKDLALVGSGYVSDLNPYLLSIKDSFSMWDPSTMSPYDVMDVIRKSTFLEIFEDRSGTFRLRFPRWNNVVIDKEVSYSEMMSCDISRGDSGNMNVVRTRLMVPVAGSFDIPRSAYIDPLSMFKYGPRITEEIQNPNCTSPSAMGYLSKFYRYYNLGRSSRSASISMIGDTSLSPGQGITFMSGYSGMQNEGVSNTGSGDVIPNGVAQGIGNTLYGYVLSVSDDISVGGTFSQSVSVGYVREASSVITASNEMIPSVKVSNIGYYNGVRWNLGFSESAMDKSWVASGDKSVSVDYLRINPSSANSAKGLNDYKAWLSPYSKNEYRVAYFRRYMSVQEFARSVYIPGNDAPSVTPTDPEMSEKKDEEDLTNLYRRLSDACVEWVEARGVLRCREEVLVKLREYKKKYDDLVLSMANYGTKTAGVAVVGESVPATPQSVIIDIKKMYKDLEGASDVAFNEVKGQDISFHMSYSPAKLSDGYRGGSIFYVTDLDADVPKMEPDSWKASRAKFSSKALFTSLKASKNDIPHFNSDVDGEFDTQTVIEATINGLSRVPVGIAPIASKKILLRAIYIMKEILGMAVERTQKYLDISRAELSNKKVNDVDLIMLVKRINKIRELSGL